MIVTVKRHELHVYVLDVLPLAHVKGIHICFFPYLTLFPVHVKDPSLSLFFSKVPKPTAVNIKRTQNAKSQLDNYTHSGQFPPVKESHKQNEYSRNEKNQLDVTCYFILLIMR